MIKNLGYKILSITLFLVVVVIVIAYTPRAYTPSATASATLDFGSTLPSASTDLTMTVTGASVGDVVILGVPNASVPANGGFFAWVSASNTVSVRFFNNDALASLDPASGSFKSTILKN
jgi:hypothetical protein